MGSGLNQQVPARDLSLRTSDRCHWCGNPFSLRSDSISVIGSASGGRIATPTLRRWLAMTGFAALNRYAYFVFCFLSVFPACGIILPQLLSQKCHTAHQGVQPQQGQASTFLIFTPVIRPLFAVTGSPFCRRRLSLRCFDGMMGVPVPFCIRTRHSAHPSDLIGRAISCRKTCRVRRRKARSIFSATE